MVQGKIGGVDDTAAGTNDVDGDGYSEDEGDCNDSDPNISPSATDEMDGIDQNCDGIDGVDMDRDEHASLDSGGQDCDDQDETVHPGADELCNDVDDDCDGVPTAEDCDDNNASVPENDADCDGVTTADDCDDSDSSLNTYDSDADGVSTCDGDCDDSDAVAEICWVSVSAGLGHTCGLKRGGSIECWGIADESPENFGQVTDTP
jgi:hypothetical protein